MASAKRTFSQAVSQDPGNAAYLHKLAAVCLALNQVEESLGYLKRAESAAPTFPEIYYALARAYGKQKNRERAAEYSQKFEEMNSGKRKREDQMRESEKRIRLGESALDEGKKTEARSLFEEALHIDPLNWDAHGYLAELFLGAGDLAVAYHHLAKMEAIDPESTVGNYLTASYYYQRREFERARLYAERVKASLPANAKLRNLLGNIYVALGRRQDAIKEYEAAVNLAPDREDYRWNLRTAKQTLSR